MKKDYTILIPNMLPVQLKLITSIMKNYGYNMKVLETEGPQIAECGLKNVHNDTCYPALLVIGQFIDALESGKYDLHKVALMITQTGGGCRASSAAHMRCTRVTARRQWMSCSIKSQRTSAEIS